MNVMQNSLSSSEIQLNIFDAVIDLLSLKPMLLLGIIMVGVFLAIMFEKNKAIPKVKTTILSLLLYYYLCLMFTNIVGIPTIHELYRLSQFGESFFHPNINLIPFSDGFGLSSILNVFLFVPFGFLCPMISRTYEHAKNVILLGLGVSVFIEITQLFTLYRVTDINDLITNVLGTIIGYLCFRFIVKLNFIQLHFDQKFKKKDDTVYLPMMIAGIAFLLGFFR